ncbi:hypothetical protein JI435_137590, partial [Parastagonospora nodorum SN15]
GARTRLRRNPNRHTLPHRPRNHKAQPALPLRPQIRAQRHILAAHTHPPARPALSDNIPLLAASPIRKICRHWQPSCDDWGGRVRHRGVGRGVCACADGDYGHGVGGSVWGVGRVVLRRVKHRWGMGRGMGRK